MFFVISHKGDTLLDKFPSILKFEKYKKLYEDGIMADKLTPEKIEEIAKNFENIQSGKVPIIKSEKEEVKLDYGSLDNLRPKDKPKTSEKRVLPLIPPSDPRLLMQVAPFIDDTLKEFDFKDRVDLSKVMYETMVKYGGLGLSANQVGFAVSYVCHGRSPTDRRWQGKISFSIHYSMMSAKKQ